MKLHPTLLSLLFVFFCLQPAPVSTAAPLVPPTFSMSVASLPWGWFLKNQTAPQLQTSFKSQALVDTDHRLDLPASYYAIRFLTTDGVWHRHNGVAIQPNALLSSDHLLPSTLQPEDVLHLQITNNLGDIHEVNVTDGFLIQPDHGYTFIVFRDPIIPTANLAQLGDADELQFGEVVYQSVVIGAERGLYPTFIRDRFPARENTPQAFTAFRVSPDKTIVGDSGDPVYLNGKVYGINNAGDGLCGSITDPEGIYQTLETLTTLLRQADVLASN